MHIHHYSDRVGYGRKTAVGIGIVSLRGLDEIIRAVNVGCQFASRRLTAPTILSAVSRGVPRCYRCVYIILVCFRCVAHACAVCQMCLDVSR